MKFVGRELVRHSSSLRTLGTLVTAQKGGHEGLRHKEGWGELALQVNADAEEIRGRELEKTLSG